ncbi:MAG: ABC transporter ATP-binding protein [Alphaproteobacteria bacterium]|nr:ABC transporter ATP-binding protein [Alphaproteobacteria bacterium]
MSVVRLSHVGKVYSNGTVALDGVSLEVRAGEFLSLVGPSGCGKSTVLRLIAGLGELSSGRVEWPGSHDEHRLGFVFQEPTLMPWATVSANVMLPLKLKGVSRADATPRVAAALHRVGLDGVSQSYPRELSGGMKMRVSIARALVTEPSLLLMDEPFAALDEITRSKLNDDLLALWQAQRLTVIFVTHSVYESVYLSSRIAVMAARPGRVVADLPIAAPYPRDEAYRTSAAYNGFCRSVSTELHRAMAS